MVKSQVVPVAIAMLTPYRSQSCSQFVGIHQDSQKTTAMSPPNKPEAKASDPNRVGAPLPAPSSPKLIKGHLPMLRDDKM